jgi:hypothetical protein
MVDRALDSLVGLGQGRQVRGLDLTVSGWLLVLVVVLVLGAGACSTPLNTGDFGDDAGTDEGNPPDLPQSECDPRGDGGGGCPEGHKCSYVEDPEPSNRCVELLGELEPGAACAKIGDSDACGPGQICWATDADGSGGVCVEFCNQALACAAEQMRCSVANDGLLPLCLPACNPLDPDCAAGWGCYPDRSDRWVCDRDRSGELGAHGDPCTCINCCDPGLICWPGPLVDSDGCGGVDGAPNCCTLVCELDGGQPVEGVCPSEAERCERFYPAGVVILGLEDVGVCER